MVIALRISMRYPRKMGDFRLMKWRWNLYIFLQLISSKVCKIPRCEAKTGYAAIDAIEFAIFFKQEGLCHASTKIVTKLVCTNFPGQIRCHQQWVSWARPPPQLMSGYTVIPNLSLSHGSGPIIAISHDLTSKGSWGREIALFQGNLGWGEIL